MPEKDYYQTLGVSRKATEKEIKAAYRTLARENHPDLHPGDTQAEERFKDINKAYETLRDAAKRAEYDQELNGGASSQATRSGPSRSAPGQRPTAARPQAANPAMGAEFNDLFSSMFGGMPGRGVRPPTVGKAASARSGSAPTAPAAESEQVIEVTLEEAFNGGQRVYKTQVEEVCPTCKGSGVSQAGRGGLQMGTMCLTCRGAGRKRHAEQIPVNIPAGIYEDAKLRLKGKGTPDAQGRPTDLFLKVRLKKHDLFEREGSDLTVNVSVPYTVMVLGGEVEVPTPGEKKQTLPVPAGTQSGQKLRLKGLGLPGLGARPPGDLYARVNVLIPREISGEERQLLQSLARLRKDSVRA